MANGFMSLSPAPALVVRGILLSSATKAIVTVSRSTNLSNAKIGITTTRSLFRQIQLAAHVPVARLYISHGRTLGVLLIISIVRYLLVVDIIALLRKTLLDLTRGPLAEDLSPVLITGPVATPRAVLVLVPTESLVVDLKESLMMDLTLPPMAPLMAAQTTTRTAAQTATQPATQPADPTLVQSKNLRALVFLAPRDPTLVRSLLLVVLVVMSLV